jgi:murein DD-endopeptidase MepM/ murein hydrolase activator NlpD
VVATMGQTGDTVFTHLHFEIRVGSRCSFQYQLANPTSSCAVGYEPHVHPFAILPTLPDAYTGDAQEALCNNNTVLPSSSGGVRNGVTGWYLSTNTPGANISFPNASSAHFKVRRPNYAINRLEIVFVRLLGGNASGATCNETNTDGNVSNAVFDFSTFEGFNPSSLVILDNFSNFSSSVFPGVLLPGEVLSSSTQYDFEAVMHPGWAIWQFRVYDVLGNGVSRNNTRWVVPHSTPVDPTTTAAASTSTPPTSTTTTSTTEAPISGASGGSGLVVVVGALLTAGLLSIIV